MITACITATIEALDASLALNRNGVYSSVTFMPESDVYSSVAYALRLWAGSHQAEIEIRQEEHGVVNYVRLGLHAIAVVHVPEQVDEPKRVVDVLEVSP